MTMKPIRIIVGYLFLSGVYLQAAATSSPPQSFDWGLTSVPTPLEEYGLTLGDITVTRVFNPIGQLQVEDPIVIARRLTHITNPWQELTPGTGLIVDGKKAVIRQIQPEAPPSEKFADKKTRLRVKLIVEEISGSTMTLEWDQVLHKLNSAETRPMRDTTVDLLKKRLRVGTHLIINGGRRIISKQNLSYNPPTSQKNRDLQFEANYYALDALEEAKATLSGRPSSSENVTDSAWKLKDGLINLPQNTAQLVTWKFWARDGDPDHIPLVTILHRARGIVSEIHLTNDRVAEAHIHSTHKGEIHTHKLKWEQLLDNKGASSWQFKDNRDDFIELFKVNDDNIRFKITPKPLLRANREAAKFFQSKKQNTGNLQLSSKILDSDTIANQIKNLQKIVDSDASEAVKLDAKRQAVIYLARFYEHKATEIQASRQEQIFRAEMKREEARKYERHAWLALNKMDSLIGKRTDQQFGHRKVHHLREEIARMKTTLKQTKSRAKKTKLAEKEKELEKATQIMEQTVKPFHVSKVEDWSITKTYNIFKEYESTQNILVPNDEKLQIEYADLFGQYIALDDYAKRLRTEAEKLKASSNSKGASGKDPVIENYNLALHFWSEYIFRTEGLNRGTRQLDNTGIENNNIPLKEAGIGSNTPAPDPYLPEILLRQAWIHRQAGLSKRAVSAYYDVLTGATKQKINNLTRFSRIALVARSQIANTYWEDAENRENINEAIDLYTRLLQSDEEKLDDEKELDSSQVQLKLLRALFKSDEYARTEIRRKERELAELRSNTASQNPNSATTYLSRNILEKERERVLGEIAVIEQGRTKNWTLLKNHADQYIEANSEEEPNLRYDGEIRYYQIAANMALDNALHVQRYMEILLDDESTPDEFQQAWLATRVRVMIDVANLLYSEAVAAQAGATAPFPTESTSALQKPLNPRVYPKHWGKPPLQDKESELVSLSGGYGKGSRELEDWIKAKLKTDKDNKILPAEIHANPKHVLPQNLEMAINGYEQALEYDQSYRSQIMLRQQIAWCQERLDRKKEAIVTYDTIANLCKMHPQDLSATLKVVQYMAKVKHDGLEQELDQKNDGEK